MNKKKLRLLIGVSGGIAAYKIPLLIRLLQKHAVEIKVVLTQSSRSLVGEEALRVLSKNPIYTDDSNAAYDMDHIRLAEWADVMLIAPATANTIAKIAHGIGDNLLTTLVLSFAGPTLIAPAMNTVMWQKPVTIDNISLLESRGFTLLPVGTGALACGDDGPGRMIALESIVDFVMHADLPPVLKGKHFLIASGPTVEPLDPVRVISNRSSGKMGAALASVALCMGAQVTVVTGPTSVELPEGVTRIDVATAQEMSLALHKHFDQVDVCIMAAAISDFRPKKSQTTKIDREKSEELSVELVQNEDVAYSLSHKKRGQFLVCFSLETESGLERAHKKMAKKGCDVMVYNRVDTSLEKDSSEITILYKDKEAKQYAPMSKSDCAKAILKEIAAEKGLLHE